MDWNRDKSAALSRLCVAAFALMLAALDVGAYWFAAWYVRVRLMRWQLGAALMATIYCGSVFAWICLYQLWQLLGSIRRGAVFTAENVRRLRAVSWCCAGAAAVCLISCLYYLPFGFVAAAALFMALIVRIVKNAFAQAVAMKDELDLTV